MRLLVRWWRHRAAIPPLSRAVPLPAAVGEARAILVVALAEAGDMVLLSVFLRGLRRLAPSARVTLLCLPGARVLYEHSPDVDEVLVYDATASRLLRPVLLPRRARAFARRELAGRFDLAIVPRWETDHHLASLLALFSRAGRRVGHSEHGHARKRTLNAGFDALFTDVVTSEGVTHEVERHLDMLRALGDAAPRRELTLALTDDDRARAAAALAVLSERATDVEHVASEAVPLVAFGIGAAHPKRRWSIAGFAQVGLALRRSHGAHFVVIGGPTDVGAQRVLLEALGPAAIGLAGTSTLRESAAVLERCDLFIGSDSAPMHLAAATGVPCVEISCHPADGDPLHNNAPERFGPWGVPSEVVRPATAVPPCASACAADAAHCILAVSPAMVIDAAERLLDQRVRRAAPLDRGDAVRPIDA
jgi:heptosyltransferase-2